MNENKCINCGNICLKSVAITLNGEYICIACMRERIK